MFNYQGNCFVRRFEGGRAKSDDVNAKAKIKINIPDMEPDNVRGILLCDDEHSWLFFDTKDRGGERIVHPRFPGITRIACGNAWENMHTIKIAGLKKHLCLQLKVTHMVPVEGGRFDVELIAIIERPSDNFLEVLAERCNREVPLHIVQTQEDAPVQVDIEDAIEAAAPETQEDAFPEKPAKKKRTAPQFKEAKSKAKKDRAALDAVAAEMQS